jgi:hypothetical protein
MQRSPTPSMIDVATSVTTDSPSGGDAPVGDCVIGGLEAPFAAGSPAAARSPQRTATREHSGSAMQHCGTRGGATARPRLDDAARGRSSGAGTARLRRNRWRRRQRHGADQDPPDPAPARPDPPRAVPPPASVRPRPARSQRRAWRPSAGPPFGRPRAPDRRRGSADRAGRRRTAARRRPRAPLLRAPGRSAGPDGVVPDGPRGTPAPARRLRHSAAPAATAGLRGRCFSTNARTSLADPPSADRAG